MQQELFTTITEIYSVLVGVGVLTTVAVTILMLYLAIRNINESKEYKKYE